MDRRRLRKLYLAGAFGLLVLLVSMFVLLIRNFMAKQQQMPERVIQTVTIIRPPPPPPETPPPPPPPEKIEQPLEQKEPEPKPDNTPAPPPPQLGLDAAGVAGGDSFGLVARQGGADLVGTGGAIFAWYTDRIKDAVNSRLTGDARLHARKFTVSVRLWIGTDGRVTQVRLTSGSGDRDIDGEIVTALGSLGSLDEAPPIEMPQPVTLQIVGHS